MAELFFLAPALAEIAESDPVEEVAFFRDEMANLVWGIERRYQGAAGRGRRPLRRAPAAPAPAAQHVETDFGDAQLVYRLATDVPDHWFPFVPVRPEGAPALDGVIAAGAPPAGAGAWPTASLEVPEPLGRVLTAADPLRLEEEEVPRSGTDVVRNLPAGPLDRRAHLLWSGRHRLVGAGEGSSGLKFDAVGPAVR